MQEDPAPPAQQPPPLMQYEQIAIEQHLFPSKELFWTELVRRKPWIDHIDVRTWFFQNAMYTMEGPPAGEKGRGRCSICCSNWSGHPVKPHSAKVCPIPAQHQVRFLATNTPAVCPTCRGHQEMHIECNEPNTTCTNCARAGKGVRYHDPILRICELPVGQEVEQFNQYREEFYADVQLASLQAPLLVQMPNDYPLQDYQHEGLIGYPPLRNARRRFPQIEYPQGSRYPGLIYAHNIHQRRDIDNLLARWDNFMIRAQQQVAQVDQAPGQAPELGGPAEQERPDVPANEPAVKHQSWEEERRAANDIWSMYPTTIQHWRLHMKGPSEVKMKTVEGRQLEIINVNHQLTVKELETVLKEEYGPFGHRGSEEKARYLQNWLTGTREPVPTIHLLHEQGAIEEYYQHLRLIAVIATLHNKLPTLRLQHTSSLHFSPYIWEESAFIEIPTFQAYVSIAPAHRFECMDLWTANFAKILHHGEDQ